MQRQLRGQANLGLVLQVLRRDVSSRLPTGTPPSSGEKRTAHALILTDKGPDVMVCPRERPNVAKNMLLDHPHGEMLLNALGAARAQLTAAHRDTSL